VNLFDDTYLGNSNEMRIIYIYDLVIPLIMMIAYTFEMMNCIVELIKYAK